MNRKKLMFAALIVIFTNGYSTEMGLEEVLYKLNKSNREISIQNMEVESQTLEEKKQQKVMFPKLSLNWQTDFIENTPEDQSNFNSGGDNAVSAKISIPLFQGGALYSKYQKSMLNKESSIQDRNLVGYSMEENAISTYFVILNKRKQAEISKMTIDALAKQEKRLGSLYENNKMISKSELLKVQADLVLEKAILNRRVKEQRSAEEALFVMLDMPLNSEIEFNENLVEQITLDNYMLDKDVYTAVKEGSEAKKEYLKLKNAGYDVKIARAELYPKLDASINYRLDSVPEDEVEYQVSLAATWEIFSWGSSADNVNQKKIKYDQALTNYQKNIDSIALEVRDQYRELESLSQEVYSRKIKSELEEENMKIDRLRYESSIIDTNDYLSSINRLSTAQDSYYSAQRDLILAMKVYENLLK